MSRRPTLGFATRTDAVKALRDAGRSVDEISELTGIERAVVIALDHYARRRRLELATADERVITLDLRTLNRLRPAAHARGISAGELARQIINTVAADNMVAAVLDDEART